ncbi:MAG TPA: 16S rRNA (cytosine(1402)-N(4))-methyltransferase RsmH [Salinivirgaceae bacterium]|nr:16S rRNA (cytosine(1402)-N(4))-methyltransferase RsmH [Salinivirgaceae bacterium]
MENYHTPALLSECIEGLDIRPDGIYVDATFGGGGHSMAILEKLTTGKLLAFDQDADAACNLPNDSRLIFVHHNFRYIRFFLRYHNIHRIDGLLADLGVSSHHFDTEDRGFSIRHNALLDMRMNVQQSLRAVDVVNQYSEDQLTRIFKLYGEVDRPWVLSKQIVKVRQQKNIETTDDLIAVVEEFLPQRFRNKELAKIFQALRIEVNRELEALEELLMQTKHIMNPHGRLVIISYHSLEDRMVKNFIKFGNVEGMAEKDFFGNVVAPYEAVNRKVIVPSEEEIARNPRVRSAKLRIAKRTVYDPTIEKY